MFYTVAKIARSTLQYITTCINSIGICKVVRHLQCFVRVRVGDKLLVGEPAIIHIAQQLQAKEGIAISDFGPISPWIEDLPEPLMKWATDTNKRLWADRGDAAETMPIDAEVLVGARGQKLRKRLGALWQI